MDDLSTGKRENVARGATLPRARHPRAARDASTRRGPTSVFHLAAQADVGTSVERPEHDAEVNVVGTVRVLEAARAAGAQVVFSSTGRRDLRRVRRARPARTTRSRRSRRTASRSSPPRSTWRLGTASTATRHVALRFGNVFGPRQVARLEGGVVSIFLERLARRRGRRRSSATASRRATSSSSATSSRRSLAAAGARRRRLQRRHRRRDDRQSSSTRRAARSAGARAEPSSGPRAAGEVLRCVLDPARAPSASSAGAPARRSRPGCARRGAGRRLKDRLRADREERGARGRIRRPVEHSLSPLELRRPGARPRWSRPSSLRSSSSPSSPS